MHATRWSPLWTFAAGCLSGAVLIGWRLEVRQSAPQSPPAQSASERAPLLLAAPMPAPTAPTAPSAPTASASPSPSSVASAEPSEEPSGDSVAEVLARLEAQYREHSAKASPPPAPPPSAEAVAEQARTPTPTPTAKVEEAAPKDERAPGLVAAAPKTSLTEAAPPEAAKPAPAPPEASAPVELAQNVSEALAESAEGQHLKNQLQQVTALQQAALVQQAALAQQFAVLQYLQLYSLSLNPRVATPARTPRAPVSHRIVDTLPSSFSASDNPWGFVYPAPVLLR